MEITHNGNVTEYTWPIHIGRTYQNEKTNSIIRVDRIDDMGDTEIIYATILNGELKGMELQLLFIDFHSSDPNYSTYKLID